MFSLLWPWQHEPRRRVRGAYDKNKQTNLEEQEVLRGLARRAASAQTNTAEELRSLTGGEASLLLALAEVRVRVEVGLQGGRRVDGLAPALPLYQVGHPALSHGCGFGHMVLHYLRNTCKKEGKKKKLWFFFFFSHLSEDSQPNSPCREDRASAAIS